ncbi:MAG: biotin/lipoyl-binding protein [Anaerolineales bacterium]|nr:biotin/lipoyl-binding protein [Anaerolineales bacterium]
MKHKIIRLIVILIILSVVGGGYWYFSQHPDQLSRVQRQLGLTSQANANDASVSGFIEAEEVSVAAEIKGRIAGIAVTEGDFVKAGQVLVELDTALLAAQVQQVQAKIGTAKAQLAKIEAGVRPEEMPRLKRR